MAAKVKPEQDVFDLDALVAEAKQEPFRFRAGGKLWTVPRYESLDWRVLEYGDANDLVFAREALRLGLGEQWDDFDALPGLGIAAVGQLFQRWVAHSGLRPGESQASSDS